MNSINDNKKIEKLQANQELRILVGDEPVKARLMSGLAEVYGTEMLVNKTYTFPRNSKTNIYTYHGAEIEMIPRPMKDHVGKKCDHMARYLEIHGELERMREEAELLSEGMNFNSNAPISGPQTSSGGSSSSQTVDPLPVIKPDLSKIPICLVCKPIKARNVCVGKSLLCRILLNYATRRGRTPIFVDLDPSQGHIGLPGTIGALSIESPIDIEAGLQMRSSMLLHFGRTSLSLDEDKSGLIYKVLVENLAKIVHSKLEQDRKSYYSGVIINASALSDMVDYELLVHACKSFKTNMVLVIDDDILPDDLAKDLSGLPYQVNVLNVPKAVTIVTSASETNVDLRYIRIKEYFYGTSHESYNPMTSEIKFSFLKRLIYRIGNPLMLPDSLMPLGTKTQENQIKVSHSDCNADDLLYHILAISYSRIDDVVDNPELVLRTNIMGFICITSVRGDGDMVSILTPQKLPSPMDHVLLYSDVRYMDSFI